MARRDWLVVREPVRGMLPPCVTGDEVRYRTSVRRASAVLALAGVWLVLLAGPAAAHPGVEDPYVPVHAVSTVALGVPSEEPSPMVEIDVTLPPDFSLQRVDQVPGWQEQSAPGQLRFFGGNVAQGGYALFTFSGVFSRKRVVELPVVTRAADGTTVDWDQPPTAMFPAAVVLPGYPEGSAPLAGLALPGAGSGGGLSPAVVVGIVAALGAAAALAAALRRRRASSAVRSTPVQAR